MYIVVVVVVVVEVVVCVRSLVRSVLRPTYSSFEDHKGRQTDRTAIEALNSEEVSAAEKL